MNICTLEEKIGAFLHFSDRLPPQNFNRFSKRGSLDYPYFSETVSAGFPSPADDHLEKRLDINDYLVRSPSSTFIIKVSGDSMKEAGIFDGDMLVVDKSKKHTNGSIVIACVNGEFTVKRYIEKGGRVLLQPENEQYKAVVISQEMDFDVWGVVCGVCRKF